MSILTNQEQFDRQPESSQGNHIAHPGGSMGRKRKFKKLESGERPTRRKSQLFFPLLIKKEDDLTEQGQSKPGYQGVLSSS